MIYGQQLPPEDPPMLVDSKIEDKGVEKSPFHFMKAITSRLADDDFPLSS